MSDQPCLTRRATAEALGAFALVFAGCGAIITNTERAGTRGSVGVSLVFGLVILAGIAAFGHISGAHYNPAVSLAVLIRGKLSFGDFIAYLVAQFAGAIVAAYAAHFIVTGYHLPGLDGQPGAEVLWVSPAGLSMWSLRGRAWGAAVALAGTGGA